MSGLLLKSRDDFDTTYNRRDAMSDDQLAQIFNYQQEDISEIEEELEDHDDDGEPAIVEEEQGDEKTPDEEEEEDVGPSQPGKKFKYVLFIKHFDKKKNLPTISGMQLANIVSKY
ncbi:unnamed protein product [Cuscuta epithymum]|uniref:Uncharacterized protein n=1 Tax=Cuscuta epithymum TaxID=186058 RepID=A0AAV0E9G6_9ASTE|nr:unnamed protein product [Cuscuta epithymum]